MPKITLQRPYEWNNQRKKIDVFIDNTKVGHVGINETVQFEATVGQHSLMLKNLWPSPNTSIEVDLSDNQNKTIKMKSFKWPLWISFLGVFLLITISSLIKNMFDLTSFWHVEAPVLTFMTAIVLFVTSKKEPLKLEV